MFALLPVDKPRGVNSRRIVDAMENASGKKVGHAGTLDPLASGVLVLAIGLATRLVPYVHVMPKQYVARYQLGVESDSDDMERECRDVPMDTSPTLEAMHAAIALFVGPIEQTPPDFSAIRVNGKRAYRLAHRGKEFTIQPRPVTIYSSRLIRYDFPYFEIECCCSSGTYMRSLGRDIAALLGTRCVMVELSRSAVGPFNLGRCASLLDVKEDTFHEKLVDPLEAFSGLPIVALGEYDIERISRGVKYECSPSTTAQEILLTDLNGRLHAVLRPTPDGKWRPALNFSKYWRSPPFQITR